MENRKTEFLKPGPLGGKRWFKPGPDVVRLHIAITDLKQSRPVLSADTTVIPVGLAISVIKRGVGGSWAGSDATGAEFMALDSIFYMRQIHGILRITKNH